MEARIGVIHYATELDTTGMTKGLVQAQKGIEGFEKYTGRAKKSAGELDQAVARSGKALQGHGNSMKTATGHTSNLVSQWNDIVVMVAAGQAPIQTMFQQGSQVTQVFSQLGGGMGALRAVGASFLGMLNPLNLATMAVIGFGSYFAQKLIPVVGEWLGFGNDMEKQFKGLTETTDAYTAAVKEASLPIADLAEKYGDLADEIERVNKANAGLLQAKTLKEMKAIGESFSKENFGSLFGEAAGAAFISSDSDRRNPSAPVDFEAARQANIAAAQIDKLIEKYKISRAEAIKLNNVLYNTRNAKTVEEQVAYFTQIEAILGEMEKKAEGNKELTDELATSRENLNKIIENGKKVIDAEREEYQRSFDRTKKNTEELVKLQSDRKNSLAEMNAAIAKGDDEMAKRQAMIVDAQDKRIKDLSQSIADESKKWAGAWDGFMFGGKTALDYINDALKAGGIDLSALMGGKTKTNGVTLGLVDQKTQEQMTATFQKQREAGADAVNRELIAAAAYVAKGLNIDIHDVLSLWYKESSFNAQVMGGDGGKYFGLNQFGPAEQAKYGIGPGSSAMDQARAVVRFNQDRGFDSAKHDKTNYYATTLGGNPMAFGKDSNGTSANDVTGAGFAKPNAAAQALLDVYPDLVEQSGKVAENVISTEKAQNSWAERLRESTANMKSEGEITAWYNEQVTTINRNSVLSEQEKKKAIIEVEVERARRVELMRLENDAKQQGINLDSVNIAQGKTYRDIIIEQANAMAEKVRQDQLVKGSQAEFRNELKQTQKVTGQMTQGFQTLFNGIVAGSMKGKQVLAQLISMIGNNLISNLGIFMNGGAKSGGFWNWAFGSIGAHANGGVVGSNISLVGERGPEILVGGGSKGSRVYSTGETRQMLRAANDNPNGGMTPHFSIGDGVQLDWLNKADARAAGMFKQGMSDYRRNGFTRDVAKHSSDRRGRG